MWGKLLSATAAEAIAERNVTVSAPPTVEAVRAFLATAETGNASEKQLPVGNRLETRVADTALYFETRGGDGNWMHHRYLAK